MAGKLLTTQSQLQCPHGASISITSSNQQVMADNGQVVTMADTFTVSGCPFQIPAPPGTIPSPCVQVVWVLGALRTRINGTFALDESSIGLCISSLGFPQGTVIVANTQQKVGGT